MVELNDQPDKERSSNFVWWKHGVVYQIYPRSFQDTDGDGVGDIQGIIQRLDYVAALGVDAIWLSPIYSSPMADFGYDVSDHTSIDPLFGNMETFRNLVYAVHATGLKIIMDYIPNHTSDRHRWFKESRSSRSNPRRDWFIWRDPAPGDAPPNNWRSAFGGPAWKWDELTGQYYYHAFLACQPDLNWRNPEVVGAMLRHVLERLILSLSYYNGRVERTSPVDKGVDGFRVDAIHHLLEDEGLTDNPINPFWRVGMDPAEELIPTHTVDLPEVHDPVARMRHVLDGYDGERVLIGEAYLPIDRLVLYYGEAGDGFHLPFNFHLITTPWTPAAVASLIAAYEAKLPADAWPNWVLGNHDRPRLASRLGADQARVAAMLLLTLRGTPTLYQGDELGMEDVAIPPDRVRDPWEINVSGLGLGRDPVRTPMLWSDTAYAGFSTVEPWLPLGDRWRELHVERQTQRPGSMLNLYRALIDLRRLEPALWRGSYVPVAVTETLLAYERRAGAERLLVILDFSRRGGVLTVPPGKVLLATDGKGTGRQVAGALTISSNEGLIIRLTG